MSGFQEKRGLFHLKLRAFPDPEKELHVFAPSGQKSRLSSSGPALLEGSKQGLALVTKAKAGELLAVSVAALLS